MTTTMTTLTATTETALSRIAVRPPYFALRDLEQVTAGVVRATVPRALPERPEHGVIAAAQVARHCAILGSCAAALSRDDDAQHHYLAMNAHYMRCAGAPTEVPGRELVGEAVATRVDKRNARALVKLMTADGQALNMLDVTFAVMTPRMFARLHPATIDLTEPTSAPLGSHPIEETATGVRMDCGAVPAELCEGHFPEYPAAPVAVVMGQLCTTAGHALARHLDQSPNYLIEQGFVQATKLASAGQHLVLEANYLHAQGNGHVLEGQALADGEVVGEVRVAMSTQPDLC